MRKFLKKMRNNKMRRNKNSKRDRLRHKKISLIKINRRTTDFTYINNNTQL